MTALRLEGVGRRFGGLAALHDITLHIGPGGCHGLIGPNGAGKTTLLNLVAGTLRPTTGRIILDGRDITDLGAAARAHRGIGRTFQHPAVFARLSVADNLALADGAGAADSLALAGGTRAMPLAGHASTPAGRLPYGLQRRLELAMVVAQRPRLLLLDEPSAGLAPDEIAELGAQIRALGEEATVLLVDHNLDLVWTVADAVTVLHHGEHLVTGPPSRVRADPAVREAYLPASGQAPRALSRGAGPVLLQARCLTAGYGGAPVLHGVDLEVHAGETVAVVGRNGAGKTTLLNAVAGLLPAMPPSRVWLDGVPLPSRQPHLPARAGVAIVPQGRRLFGPLTVAEHLLATAPRRSGSPLWTVERVLALLPEIATRADHPAARLSGGEQQMLALARALLTNPRVLILDEPSEGLAPTVIARLATTLSTLAGQGMAILLAEQNQALATAVADRVLILDGGRLVSPRSYGVQ